MVDLEAQILIERAINSRTKLQLLLMFYENPRMEVSAALLSQRCCRDIWSVKKALQEMAEDGFLLITRSIGSNEVLYHYSPRADYFETIGCLMSCYNDPFSREELLQIIHEHSDYTLHHTVFDRLPL